MNNTLIFWLLPSVIAIGLLDYAVLRRILKCEKCGAEVHWTQFILPTFIELTLFVLGFICGRV